MMNYTPEETIQIFNLLKEKNKIRQELKELNEEIKELENILEDLEES